MQITPILAVTVAVVVALFLLTVETLRELNRMDKKPRDYTGSNRLAGTAE